MSRQHEQLGSMMEICIRAAIGKGLTETTAESLREVFSLAYLSGYNAATRDFLNTHKFEEKK